MDNFLQSIKSLSVKLNKTIVLAEGEDLRTLEATKIILKENISKLILLGDPKKILSRAKSLGVNLENVTLINPNNNSYSDKFSNTLYEIRKHKGLNLNEAKKLVTDPLYFGTLLVYFDIADGMVAGASNTTAATLKPALQIIKTLPNKKIVSGFFIMSLPNKNFGEDGVMLFADCSLNISPTASELAEITLDSADTFTSLFQKNPKIALLSYSTHGSAKGESVDKVIESLKIIKSANPQLQVDGELQADAALIPHVCKFKSPQSILKGQANILIFPDLNSGNISYKLVERLAGAKAFGPMTQGLAKPINDLSRGCCCEDIVYVTALTSIQAEFLKQKRQQLQLSANGPLKSQPSLSRPQSK